MNRVKIPSWRIVHEPLYARHPCTNRPVPPDTSILGQLRDQGRVVSSPPNRYDISIDEPRLLSINVLRLDRIGLVVSFLGHVLLASRASSSVWNRCYPTITVDLCVGHEMDRRNMSTCFASYCENGAVVNSTSTSVRARVSMFVRERANDAFVSMILPGRMLVVAPSHDHDRRASRNVNE